MAAFDVAQVFRGEFGKALLEEQESSGFPVAEWFFTGRGSVQDDIAWWDGNGPDLCQAYIDWFESQPDAEIWTAPDGRPGVELGLEVMFGTVPVKMFIDQVLQCGSALVVTDLKSGTRKPDNLRQLAIYASGIELAYGIRPKYGTYFMHRGTANRKDGERRFFLQPRDLGGYEHSVHYLARQFEMLDRAAREGIFIPDPGEQCGRCGVADACSATGGRDARLWDPGHPQFKGAVIE